MSTTKPHCFAVRRRDIKLRFDPKFIVFGGHHFLRGTRSLPLQELVVTEPEYGPAIKAMPMSSTDDVKYIRISDFGDDGIEFNHEFMTAEIIDDKYLLEDGDILFARSGATVGKTFIYTKEIGPAIFAGYCIRFKFNSELVLPWYVYLYTKTKRYKKWVMSMQRPSGQPNINKEEFKSFTIPIISLKKQQELIDEMLESRNRKNNQLTQADTLLNGIDEYILKGLGLSKPTISKRLVFAVNSELLCGKRMDPPAYIQILNMKHGSKTPLKKLSCIAVINQNRTDKPSCVDTLVPYVGLPECNNMRIREVTLRPYEEVKNRGIALLGDILFARIEPSVFNKKYVLVDDLRGYPYIYTSTEFYVVRAKPDEIIQDYLYVMFFCSFVHEQVKGRTTGSSGRRRISSTFFKNLQIPVPSKQKQETVVTEVLKRQNKAISIQKEAEYCWADAIDNFEKKLLAEGTRDATVSNR